MARDFHDKPYDAGTVAKLRIFELYAQEWIPVFLSQPQPRFSEAHVFDFFAGPGKDCEGVPGSPLRILEQFRRYYERRMAGWSKVRIVVHFFDEDREKIERLASILGNPEWKIPGVQMDCKP
jgi:three-Cys-motif partner protein